jgi:hypothetical protein
MTSIFTLTAALFRSVFSGRQALILENLALRQQLAVYKRMEKRPGFGRGVVVLGISQAPLLP